MRTIVTLLDPDEQERLREMEEWIIKDQGTWVLAESFNNFLGNAGESLFNFACGNHI